MAGGADWVLRNLADKSTVRQRVTGGPWYIQKALEITISKNHHGRDVSTAAGMVGETSGIVVFSVGRTVKTRSLGSGERFICTCDQTINDQTAGAAVTRLQTWLYVAAEETEV